MSFLLIIHSYLRWLILIVALIAVVKFACGLAARRRLQRHGSRTCLRL